MGWSRNDEEAHADYERDLRKPDSLPIPPLNGDDDMRLAVAVRTATNDHAAAGLIQAYVRAATARENLNNTLERIAGSGPQRCAAAKLIGYCEGLCKHNLLGERIESELRVLIAETLSAFHMDAANRDERQQAAE